MTIYFLRKYKHLVENALSDMVDICFGHYYVTPMFTIRDIEELEDDDDWSVAVDIVHQDLERLNVQRQCEVRHQIADIASAYINGFIQGRKEQ